MVRATLIRTATLAALVGLALAMPATPATAADPAQRIVAPTVQVYGDKSAQFTTLGVGKSIVVDLPGDIKDVLVADPKIANAVVRTSRRAYIIGVAIGMGAYGLRPVPEIQFADYIYPALDQLVSEAARLRYRSGGEFTAPITVRSPFGGGIFGGQTHSQSPEAIFTHITGLKTVIPSGSNNRTSANTQDPGLYT